ncbi:MAG: sugar phosphate isomerase/epimerase [Chloroflexi bacterium]|nr:sugar phosphate isomerase/epimerase [Chloroflexota bacterium]
MNTPALSTMWMQRRHAHVREFLEAGRRVGFTRFELGHVVRPEMLEGITRADGEFPSIHAPCPTTVGLGGAAGIVVSALDEDKRRAAVALHIQTMDWAEALGAGVIVIHIGHVEVDRGLERELRRLYIAQQEDSPRYAALRRQLQEARAAQAAPYLDAVRRSLETLSREAARRGLRLAVENRYHYHEIPTPAEAHALLAEFGDVEFWYDTGHAHVMHNLGFIPYRDWLNGLTARLAGIHLHDVIGTRDHLVCGLGEVDWAWVREHLKPDTFRTCEFDWYFEAEHLWPGVEFLARAGCL